MLALDHEIGFSEIALVELAGGTLTSFANLNAEGYDGSTLLADAISSVDFSIAGQSNSSLAINAYAQLGLDTAGSGVFDAEVQKLVVATLAAAGAAQVLILVESEPVFAFVGTGTTNFVGEARTLALFSSSSASTTSFSNVAIAGVRLNSAGHATTTVISSAHANTIFSAPSASSSAIQLQAYG